MEKARLIVLTDIGPWEGEPDDAQSLVRLMLYANEYDIEGIIPNASWCGPDTSDDGYMQRIIDVVKAYGKVRENLCVHADGYPTEEYLLSVVKRGTNFVNMKRLPPFHGGMSADDRRKHIKKYLSDDSLQPNVGEGLSNEGSRLIIRSLEKEDVRPLWIALWGGCGTLAQALYDLRKTKDDTEIKRLCAKLRIYDIDGQDDCGAWICCHFPEIKWMRSDVSFWGFSETPANNKAMFGEHCYVGDLSTVTEEWIKEHMQSKGALGKVYPLAHYGLETDSPSILNLVQNGLGDPEHQNWGGWGGRHTLVKSQNPPAEHFYGTFLYEQKPFYMHRDDVDTWYDEHNGKWLKKSLLAPIARWRQDYQYDMAVRMLWSVSNKYEDCNHNPVVVLNGDQSKDAVMLNVCPGDSIRPNTAGTFDPDGDALTYRWYVYPEAGTYSGKVAIDGENTSAPIIHIPKDAAHEEIHVILEVQDNGKGFPLKSYRRLVLKTGDTGMDGKQTFINDTDFTYTGNWEYKTDQYGSHDRDVHVSNTKDDIAELHFSGSRIMLYGAALNHNGIAAISIDDGEETMVDFYSYMAPWKDKYELSRRVTTGETLQYVSLYLAPGEHTLRVRVTGSKNEDAENCNVVIDRAVVFR